jgi:hypothetical protein
MTVTIKSLAVAILRACKLVHQEASAIMSRKLQRLEQEPIRVETDIDTLIAFGGPSPLKVESFPVLRYIHGRCLPFLLHTPLAHRHSPDAFQVEVAVRPSLRPTKASQVFQLSETLATIVSKWGISCAVRYKGLLPPSVVRPGRLLWEEARQQRQFVIFNTEYDRPLRSLMRLEEMEEGDWTRMLQEWACL